jgi:FkbM family methyltransferase
MLNFKNELSAKLTEYQFNNFGIDNFDEFRGGKYSESEAAKEYVYSPPNSPLIILKNLVKKIIGYKKTGIKSIEPTVPQEYEAGLQNIYEHLNETGRKLLIDLLAYRQLGLRKVKLPTNNKEYWEALETGKKLADPNDTYDPHFMHLILQKMDLNPIGYNIKFYFSGSGVVTDFILEQYTYKQNAKEIVSVKKGDIVLDMGACWGDTALYFAHKTGETGKVYSFEFIPNNIKLFNINKSFNSHLANQIELVPHPVSNKTGDKIYFKDNGPGSKVESKSFDGQTGETTTLAVDDFVKQNNISKIDFIKMDIEGAEPFALEGALETIKKHKPKLAIAIYHGMDDFVNIPNWILNLNLGYEIFIDHFTIHAEETICFAKIKGQ